MAIDKIAYADLILGNVPAFESVEEKMRWLEKVWDKLGIDPRRKRDFDNDERLLP